MIGLFLTNSGEQTLLQAGDVVFFYLQSKTMGISRNGQPIEILVASEKDNKLFFGQMSAETRMSVLLLISALTGLICTKITSENKNLELFQLVAPS